MFPLQPKLIRPTLERLYRYSNFEQRRQATYNQENYHLDHIRKILTLMREPQKKYSIIHVAGTKGKGSCVHYLAHFLEALGVKTGHTLSPQIIDERDRFYHRGERSNWEEIIPIFEKILNLMEYHRIKSTVFDIFTAASFQFFADHQVEIGIVETGMGGRWDSTNIVDPRCSFITRIDWDHTDKLGDTLTKIAYEKAGIIKPLKPVFYLSQTPLVNQVIERVARDNKSKSIEVDKIHPLLDQAWNQLHDEMIIHNLALKNNINLVLHYLMSRQEFKKKISSDLILKVILKRPMIARQHQIGRMILDGAHTPLSIRNLVQSIKTETKKYQKVKIFFYCISGKKIKLILQEIPKHWQLVWLDPQFFYISFQETDRQFKKVKRLWEEMTGQEIIKIHQLPQLKENELGVITGSFRLVGWVLSQIHLQNKDSLNRSNIK